MSHITKIAAIENATAIWEYDPSWQDNRVLGGSLDIIAAVRTLAIKVNCNYLVKLALIYFIRYRRLVNVSSTFKACSSAVDFPELWRSFYIVTFDGGLLIKCSTRQTNFVRSAKVFFFFLFHLHLSSSLYPCFWVRQMRCMVRLWHYNMKTGLWNTYLGLPSRWWIGTGPELLICVIYSMCVFRLITFLNLHSMIIY
jgi:hypothetical protein